MPVTTTLTALAALGAAAAAPVLAADPITITFDEQGNRVAEVDVSSYNLTTDEGMEQAEWRIASAARSVCSSASPNRLRKMYEERTCETQAVHGGKAQLAALAEQGVEFASISVAGGAK